MMTNLNLWVVTAVIILVSSNAVPSHCQERGSKLGALSHPEFEVVSIRPNNSGSNTVVLNSPPGHFVDVTAKMLIAYAYKVNESRISGGPEWVDNQHFDVTGIIPELIHRDLNNDFALLDSVSRLMLRATLSQRFGLSLKHMSIRANTYSLVVSKSGSILTPSDQKPAKHAAVQEGLSFQMGLDDERGTLAQLAEALGDKLETDVIDETHLSGTYHIRFYVPISSESEDGIASVVNHALHRQLGLGLVTLKRAVDAYQIVAISPPSPN